MPNLNLDRFPSDLKRYDHYVYWKYEPDSNNPKKQKKPPISPMTGNKCSVIDPTAWTSFETAVEFYGMRDVDGIGLVLTEDMGLTVIDIDDCRNEESGKLNRFARKTMEMFPSYTEVSPSGTGIHIFIWGRLPGKGLKTGDVEAYDRERYMTVTGRHVKDSPSNRPLKNT